MEAAIVLDWDGVIFDDDAYKAELFKNIEFLGISKKDIAYAYDASKDLNGYNDRKLARFLAEQPDAPALDEILSSIKLAMSETRTKFIYDDIVAFLNEARSHAVDVFVLTAGDTRIQTEKYTNSGLAEYFKDVLIVPADETALAKEHRLSELLKHYQSVYFYDDKPSTILHLHEVFRDTPAIVPIIVDRYKKYESPSSNGFIVTNLTFNSLVQFAPFYKKSRTLIAANRIYKNNSLLLVHENAGRAMGKLSLPMGHVDSGQLFIEAASREAKEETGYEVKVLHFRKLIAVDGAQYLGSDYDLDRTIIIVCFDSMVQSNAQQKEYEFTSEWITLSDINDQLLRGDWHTSLLT